MGAHVIYRGPVEREPETINLPVAGAYLPGTFVTSDLAEFTQAADSLGRLMLLNNRRFYTQTDVDAYEADETGIAYRLEVEQEYRAVVVAATYAYGDPLTVNASGLLAAATAGTKVVAYFDGAGAVIATDSLADIVIANSYISA
jgi:hypothetical protein